MFRSLTKFLMRILDTSERGRERVSDKYKIMQEEGRCSKYASTIPNRWCELNVLTIRERRVWGTTTKHLLSTAYALRKTGCIFTTKFSLTCNFDELIEFSFPLLTTTRTMFSH